MPPVTEQEIEHATTGAANMGAFGLDEAAMDAEPKVRETNHPFQAFLAQVREACKLPDSQRTREVVSEVCGHVARLVTVVEDEIDAQANHIAEMVAEDRKTARDPQVWFDKDTKQGAAKRIAEHALELRLAGKAPIADNVND